MQYFSIQYLFTVCAILGLASSCVTDNVLRAMSSYRYSAGAFCSSYIRSTITTTLFIPTRTITIANATFTPKATLTVTMTTLQTVTVQVVETITTSLYPAPIKREFQPRGILVPPYLSSFDPNQISSACSRFVTPLPPLTSTTVTLAIWTKDIDVTATLPTFTVTTAKITTRATTTTQTATTVVPNCAPVPGCIFANSSWEATPPSYALTSGLACEYYCTGIGGCLSWQLGVTADGPTCNFLGIAGWRAWDPAPGATAASPGVGGGNCSDFWIYERACPYISGFPSL